MGSIIFVQNREKPKLILQITADQLRGDMPTKFMKNMGKGGFRYLKEKDIWYTNAYYGRSPRNIKLITFSDELFLKTNGKSKVFGVSAKGRGTYNLLISEARAYVSG